MLKPLIIIAGPTAVGKSNLAVELALKIGGEIISADSMQVYRGMDIGSAKITTEEMKGVKHYLIDDFDPKENFDVTVFQKKATNAIDEIIKKGKVPIIAGGTGFYIQSVLYGIDFTESEGSESEFRKELESQYDEKGPEAMFEILKKVDPVTAGIIHQNDRKRVLRALEFFYETNRPISEHNLEEHNKESVYNSAYFVLNDEREKVYDRINLRVDKMLEKGLVKEVEALKDKGLVKTDVSMQGLGYKEILMYLDNEISLDEAVYRIKRDSRHFAKRQITWFKREKDVIWLNKPDFRYDDEKILQFMMECLKKQNII